MNTRLCAALALAAILLPGAAHAQGYTLTTLASFNGTNGSGPTNSLILSGATLYGVTGGGGTNSNGVVFSLPVTGGTPTVLASFSGTNGSSPSGLTLSGSTLYGTTLSQGPGFGGTVFSLPITGGTPTTLANFSSTGGGPANPSGTLALSGGILYGTTQNGGDANNDGTVFSLPITGGAPTTLVTFSGTNGKTPNTFVILSGSTLYGTTFQGGNTTSDGTVFSVPITGGAPTVLANFNGANGRNTQSGLAISADGSTLYGVTNAGGASDQGVVFSLPASGGTPTVLFNFDGGPNGADPSNIIVSGSTLFGTTAIGGANGDGTVFSLPITGGTPTVLASFNGANGQFPVAGLTLGPNGTLYGITTIGGANNDGTVFALTPTPEPSPIAALTVGIFGLGALTLKARRRTA